MSTSRLTGKDTASRTKREALSKLGEIQQRKEEEEKNGIPVYAPRTFTEYAEEYLNDYSKSNKAPGSYRRDKTSMKKLLQAFGQCTLSSIQTKQIELYKRQRKTQVSNASVNRELALLKHMYTIAIDWDYTTANPAKRVKLFKEPPGRIRFLTQDELENLLKECTPALRVIVLIDVRTGMRKGELQNLMWKDVDLDRKSITIKKSKNNEMRTVPICDELLPVLQRLYIERLGPYVIAKSDGSQYGDWKKGFDAACKRAGIEDFRFHDLRHTFASNLVMAGVDIRTVQELMGHKDIKMTMRYAHLSKPHLLVAVNKVGTNLAHLVTEVSENLTS